MQQPAEWINRKEQVLTRISFKLGVTTVRLSCVDVWGFFLVVITCTFIAEGKFPRCLCSMTHHAQTEGKTSPKRTK